MAVWLQSAEQIVLLVMHASCSLKKKQFGHQVTTIYIIFTNLKNGNQTLLLTSFRQTT
jgi:hypothetical protein